MLRAKLMVLLLAGTLVAAPEEVIEVFRSNMAQFGTFSFVGFVYPPRARQALALVQSTSGERGVVPIPMEEANRAIRGRSDPPTPALSHHQSLCSEL
jgi:hypothetical protein